MASTKTAHPAKKIEKKAAKKGAKKAAAHHRDDQDLRRTYEHVSRIRLLYGALPKAALQHMETLSSFAQASLTAGDSPSAADFLRAAEHLAFGSLAPNRREPGLSAALNRAARSEFEHLRHRAAVQHELPPELAAIFDAMTLQAEQAGENEAWHRALELARGAEALTHVSPVTRRALPPTPAAFLSLRA